MVGLPAVRRAGTFGSMRLTGTRLAGWTLAFGTALVLVSCGGGGGGGGGGTPAPPSGSTPTTPPLATQASIEASQGAIR